LEIILSLAQNGFILSVVGVIVAFLIFFKQRRYPGRILFASRAFLSVYSDAGSSAASLEVMHGGRRIDGKVYFLRGYVINSGLVDIEKSMVERPLSIALPDGFEWISPRFLVATDGPGVEIVAQGSSLNFQIGGVFKREECIEFEVMIRSPKSMGESEFSDIAKFNYRISQVPDKVRWLSVGDDQFLAKVFSGVTNWKIWFPRASFIGLLVMFVASGYFFSGIPSHDKVSFRYSEGDSEVFKLARKPTGELVKIDFGTRSTSLFSNPAPEVFPEADVSSGGKLMEYFPFFLIFLIFIAEAVFYYPMPMFSKGRAKYSLIIHHRKNKG